MELSLFKNYLANRQHYVQVETFNSELVKSPECSVIQGSKMSGILYCIYVNEVPLLHRLMNNKIYESLTKDNICNLNDKIVHETFNFVDDSSSIIGFPNTKHIKIYLTKYYKLLHNFYNINMLKINSDKTKLMLGYNKKYKNELENFYFFANNDKINNQKSLKILGFILRYDSNMETQIGNLCSNLHFRIFNIKN